MSDIDPACAELYYPTSRTFHRTWGRVSHLVDDNLIPSVDSVQGAPPTLDREGGVHKYSRAFKEIIERCLAKDPSLRFVPSRNRHVFSSVTVCALFCSDPQRRNSSKPLFSGTQRNAHTSLGPYSVRAPHTFFFPGSEPHFLSR